MGARLWRSVLGSSSVRGSNPGPPTKVSLFEAPGRRSYVDMLPHRARCSGGPIQLESRDGLRVPGRGRGRHHPAKVVLLSIDAYVPMVVLIGRALVIGSAWRCAILQVSPSRRKIRVARSASGLMFSLPATRASVRSIWTT